ncbi:hypothetical protein [Parvimonas sp. D9]|uniref:hypothetical protein n=1 Tax=Parvimonas sp. D9 TaxID=3110689 RepID=UPI002B4A7542|nr:hypothetical protein [Parvimonas sp. D9]MEB3059247.1 hypothetical protein [Parvimonas sp. D9]
MKLKEIENKYAKIEVEILKKEKERDNLSIEVATLEAQVKVKNSKFFDLDEEIADLREEKRKLEVAREIILTPAQLDNASETEEEKQKQYDSFKANHKYIKGDRFKESNRLYEVVYDHTSDEKFNKLATNKYQLIDEDGKPIFNYSVLKTYNKFEKCLSDDHIYSSKINKNGTSPITNPENWIKVD